MTDDVNAGKFPLRDDYVRLNCLIRYEDGTPETYRRPVTEVYSAGTTYGDAQFNGHTSGKDDNPALVDMWLAKAGNRPTPLAPIPYHAERAIELFPKRDEEDNVRYKLEYDAAYDQEQGLATPYAGYFHAVCAMTASLVFETLGDKAGADRMRAIAERLLDVGG